MAASKYRKWQGGHTLLEVLISCALVGICLLGVLSLVRAGSRYLLVTNAKTALQQDALRLIRRLSEEFAESNDGSFQVGNAGNGSINKGVIFASPRSPVTGEVVYDLAGRMFWPKYVAYYAKMEAGVPCVVRVVAHIPTPPPFPPAAPSLDTFLSTPMSYKVISRNVTLFDCVQTASCMELHVRVDLPSGYGRKYGFEAKTQVFTRN